MPEPGAEHIFGLGIEFLVECDLVELVILVAGIFAAGHGAGELDPGAELVSESELLGIGEVRLREDQHAAIFQRGAAGLDRLVIEQMRLVDMDYPADERLDRFNGYSHFGSVPSHSPTRREVTDISTFMAWPLESSLEPLMLML